MSSTLELCMVEYTDMKMHFGQGDMPLVLPPHFLGVFWTHPLAGGGGGGGGSFLWVCSNEQHASKHRLSSLSSYHHHPHHYPSSPHHHNHPYHVVLRALELLLWCRTTRLHSGARGLGRLWKNYHLEISILLLSLKRYVVAMIVCLARAINCDCWFIYPLLTMQP